MKTAINIICYQHETLRSQGLQLKVNGENLKTKFEKETKLESCYIMGLTSLESPNMRVRDVIKISVVDYFFWRRCHYFVSDM